PGEPAGIGPDLTVLWAQRDRQFDLIAIADPTLLRARAKQLGLPLSIHEPPAPVTRAAGQLSVRAIPTAATVVAGRLDTANALYVIETLKLACDGCLTGGYKALVTGPVQKSVINDAGIRFTGHTEFLAERCQPADAVMMLVAGTLRVALVTTHVPLGLVPSLITKTRLTTVLRVLE